MRFIARDEALHCEGTERMIRFMRTGREGLLWKEIAADEENVIYDTHEISRRTRNELGRLSLQRRFDDWFKRGYSEDFHVKYRNQSGYESSWPEGFISRSYHRSAGLDEQVVVNRHTANCTTRGRAKHISGRSDRFYRG